MKKILFFLLLVFVISEKMNLVKKEGEEFTITIPGNPTTGYNWYLDNQNQLNDNVITVLNLSKAGIGQYVPNPNPQRLSGSGGNFVFKFKANKASPNPKILRFIYKRSWNKNFIKEKIYKVTVVENLH